MSATTEQRTTTLKPGAVGKAGSGAPGEAKDGKGGKDKSGKGSFIKSKKFLIAVVGVLALGGGAYKFAMPHTTPPPVGGDVVAIDPMTVNLSGGHYLKIAAAVQLVKGKATATDFDPSHAAELLIDEFSNRPVQSLDSNAARGKLKDELQKKVQKAYPGEVFAVYLTQFVSQ